MIPVYFLYKDEGNLEENWQRLEQKIPHSIRIRSVGSIFESHKYIASICEQDKFCVVDGDSWIVDNFHLPEDFELKPKSVAVFRAKNPINGLVYGHGGVKLFSKDCFELEELDKPDMTTTVASQYIKVNIIATEHRFNYNPFATWRTAFREAVKLSAGINKNNNDIESKERLDMWCNAGGETLFGYFSIQGARAGTRYTHSNHDASKVNDFPWLEQYFKEWLGL